ncbi:acyl-CoA desaturase [Hoyosella rhizosphaerae]|uniref:Fatty acid desaturase n=1 Tax=Hoyosella rhizosphaerae TaxID=1755582 RepID=A0A916U6M6_9ACTN|nr:acyl-CoA desaturase [Hoyosella rhizosphaerae]MBN4926228.1 acyl-CoA desaturase [Hoyosella rhizosphaerae]GGC61065.1 fatty acid desaturase [Hoyosella rhizosphaerae]
MAISDIAEYSHLSASDIEALRHELDSIRREVEESLGERDARYITRTIAAQRTLDAASRLLIFLGGRSKTALVLGTIGLGAAKSIENMEIGHNVLHGQWDWMNDPEIHSSTWEWDLVGTSEQWKYAHNVTHHKYTNIIGMDSDVGFGIIRVTRDQEWRPVHLVQPLQNIILGLLFEWGIALHDLPPKVGSKDHTPLSPPRTARAVPSLVRKIANQTTKDYIYYPALSGPRWKRTLGANVTANVMRNLWTYVVIFCGHFPDGAEKFSLDDVKDESQGEWYLRQMLGTANINAGPALAFMTGNLCYQIEHHLFPDLPSNRYAEISTRVQALCDKYDLPYTTGSLPTQYLLTLRTINKLALPDKFLRRTSDDAPETASELRFSQVLYRAAAARAQAQSDNSQELREDIRRGLRTAIAELKRFRREQKRTLRRARRAARARGLYRNA